MKRRAAAIRKTAHELFKTTRTSNEFTEVYDFSRSELLPARADGRIFTNAAEEDADFAKGKTHFAGEANEEYAIEGFRGIAALATCARWRWKKADFFVIPDGGSVEACLPGKSADFHFESPKEDHNGKSWRRKAASTNQDPTH